MSPSSGRFVTDRTMWVDCDGTSTSTFLKGTPHEFTTSWACMFEGNEDVSIDPEICVAWWVCPACGTEHDVAWDDIVGGDAA